jgi:hypothetical protein
MQFIMQQKLPETECQRGFEENQIDACVTYPPISTHLLENPELHTIYSSKQHPQRIFDVMWVKSDLDIETQNKFKTMWFEVIDLIANDPPAYHQFVADISSVPFDSVKNAMQGIQLVNEGMHESIMSNSDSLAQDFVTACTIARGENCQQFKHAFKGKP